ncbi:MAG: glycosyltransferase [Phycisphaerales bacterium]|nr:glycosyltransferase [Phycisphaerales bacterium]
MSMKVHIYSATAGIGHVRAAQAIESAFQQHQPDTQVQHHDALAFTNRVFRKLYAQAYLEMVRLSPAMFGWLYDRTDKPWRSRRFIQAVNKINTRPLVRMISREQPDIVVCTHFLPVEILCRLKRRGLFHQPIVTVITDLDAHAFWLAPEVDHYCVALEETAKHLAMLGIHPSKISVTGIPIDQRFAEPCDRVSVLKEYELTTELPTLLISTGGFGVVGNVSRMLQMLLAMRHPVQMLIVCGKNARLKSLLEEQLTGQTPEVRRRIRVLGFTSDMHKLMAAADLLVGKPGGLTTSEALSRRLPMCVVNPIPGQEERNSDHLLEDGCAIRCNNLPTLGWKLDQLLDNPTRLQSMRKNVQRLAHPHAAHQVMKILVRLAAEHQANVQSHGVKIQSPGMVRRLRKRVWSAISGS